MAASFTTEEIESEEGTVFSPSMTGFFLDALYTDVVALRMWQSPGAQGQLFFEGCQGNDPNSNACDYVIQSFLAGTDASGYAEVALPSAGRTLGRVSPCL